MSHRRSFTAVAAALTALLATIVAAGSAGAATSGSVRLSGTASPLASQSPRAGNVDGSTPIDFEVELALPNRAAAMAFTRAVSTPDNPQYHHFLTPAQWEQRYSPSRGAVDEVVAFLRSAGFRVTGVSADRMAVQATGSAARVEHAFATQLGYHRFRGQKLRVTERDLAVPAGLAHVVAGVTGISQVLTHPNITTGAALPGSTPPPPPGFRVGHPCSTYYGQLLATTLPPLGSGYPSPAPWAPCGYTPPQFRGAYNLTGGPNGSGVTVAIVDAYAAPTILSDAQRYAQLNDPANPLGSSQFSQILPSSFNELDLCGANGWWGEETLDVEAVHATAPGAHILFVAGRNCGQGDLTQAVRKIVDGHLAEVISNSYGDNGGDVLDPASVREATDNVLIMAGATGVSVMYSSGDNGDQYTTLGRAVADYPPSSPYATAVGGTSLQVDANNQRAGEFGWSTGRSDYCDATYANLGGCTAAQIGTWSPIGFQYGGGGGTSYVYGQPFYQVGVVPYALSHFNHEVTGNDAMRVEPDISMDADPSTGMLVGETQTFPNGVYYDQYRIGGTSLASPLMAGVVARAIQGAGHPVGFLNPLLYSLYGNSSALNDILPAGKQYMARADLINSINEHDGKHISARIIGYQGTEQFCEASGKCRSRDTALKATPGYDNMTGLGSVGNGFVAALASL